ncbi:UvrD-helicase domain-containing protein [Actinocrinis puniceicyclus]|uniref:UvrD-helicase domain-containing protein n=1 Tax=Actinocrinis puniceicyclus TaxID=977794 RepID=A0A8J8BA97_9ACTN|nr:UvrD-helicase domain-containing protein [Actinocrinis puniceicyclus]MBS2961853.1 UvrD-helicase domain-containing protein [Actinocrinis puniceicyclus]
MPQPATSTGAPDRAQRAEMQAEQRHVDRVHERLEVMRRHARAYEAEGHRRALFGNEGGLVERDAIVYQAAVWLRRLDSQEEGLVFGRLDFDDGEIRHIGRIGVRDEEYEPLVVDWRAPAAAAFYRATPAERMDVVRRRTIRCVGAKVTRLDDDLLDPDRARSLELTVVGDGALMAALTRKRGAAMHDIVATIQKEQDLAVRSPAEGATIITGGPGTGKTAVALHRAAYLLFNERKRFESGGVLIVGPSAVFVSYIEQVLPSLGEHTAALRSLGELVEGVRATRHDPADLAQLKGSGALLPVLGRAVRATPPGTPRQFRATYHGHVIQLDGHRLDDLRRTVLHRNSRPNAARANAETALVEAAWERLPAELRERRRTERAIFDRDLRDRSDFELFVQQWWPYRTAQEVLRMCGDPQTLARYAGRHLDRAQVEALAESWRGRGDDGARDFAVEDVPLLDELAQLLGTAPQEDDDEEDLYSNLFEGSSVAEVSSWADRTAQAGRRDRVRESFAHVIVDEAQDLSPMQWRVLGRLGRRATWTIVGDPVQSAWPDPQESAAAMRVALGDRTHYVHELRTNYRNSAEIFAYAAQYARKAAPEASLPDAVRSTGIPPEHREDLESAVDEALAAVEGTVGVITALGTARATASRLGARVDAADGRLVVIDALDAKGLEYDAAVVLDPEEIEGESPAGTRTLYVALTRATQRLYICRPGSGPRGTDTIAGAMTD